MSSKEVAVEIFRENGRSGGDGNWSVSPYVWAGTLQLYAWATGNVPPEEEYDLEDDQWSFSTKGIAACVEKGKHKIKEGKETGLCLRQKPWWLASFVRSDEKEVAQMNEDLKRGLKEIHRKLLRGGGGPAFGGNLPMPQLDPNYVNLVTVLFFGTRWAETMKKCSDQFRFVDEAGVLQTGKTKAFEGKVRDFSYALCGESTRVVRFEVKADVSMVLVLPTTPGHLSQFKDNEFLLCDERIFGRGAPEGEVCDWKESVDWLVKHVDDVLTPPPQQQQWWYRRECVRVKLPYIDASAPPKHSSLTRMLTRTAEERYGRKLSGVYEPPNVYGLECVKTKTFCQLKMNEDGIAIRAHAMACLVDCVEDPKKKKKEDLLYFTPDSPFLYMVVKNGRSILGMGVVSN